MHRSLANAIAIMLVVGLGLLSGCSGEDEEEAKPTRIERAAADCNGYVKDFFEDGIDASQGVYVGLAGEESLNAYQEDSINCLLQSLRVSDQTRSRLHEAIDGREIEVFEDGLRLKAIPNDYVAENRLNKGWMLEIQEQD